MFAPRFVLALFNGPQDLEQSHFALDTLLEALVVINLDHLRRFPNTIGIYDAHAQGRLRYVRQGPGVEDWQDIQTVMTLGHTDCKVLAAWRVAELRFRGETGARVGYYYKRLDNGNYLYHMVVVRADGTIEDISRTLGMPAAAPEFAQAA